MSAVSLQFSEIKLADKRTFASCALFKAFIIKQAFVACGNGNFSDLSEWLVV
jgi:hypothetical protein